MILSLQAHPQSVRFTSLKKTTPDRGLSSSYITKVIQDKYGFMWIGTQDGLNRYDGRSLINFTRKAKINRRLGNILVTDIAEDSSRGHIWVSTSYGDITCIDEKTASTIKRITKDSFSNDLSKRWIRSLCIYQSTLWVGFDDGIMAYDLEKDVVLPDINKSADIPEKLSVARLRSDRSGKIWALCDNSGVIIFDALTRKKLHDIPITAFQISKRDKLLRFWDCTSGNSVIYIASSHGLLKASLNTDKPIITSLNSNTSLDSNEVFSCYFGPENNLWASTQHYFFQYQLSDNRLLTYKEEKNETDDWFSLVYQVYVDKNNYVWIGTQEGLGSFQLKQKVFSSYSKPSVSSEKINHAYSILPVSDTLTYCGDENGLFMVNTSSNRIEKVMESGSNLLIYKDSKNTLYVSNKDGLFISSNNSIFLKASDIYPELFSMTTDLLNCAIELGDTVMLFSSVQQRGLYIWKRNTKSLALYHENSVDNPVIGLSTITNMYKAQNGKVYLLSDKPVLTEFNPQNNTFRRFNLTNSSATQLNFMDMCETADSYWFGLYSDGVIQTDKNFRVIKTITTEDGLSNDVVYKIIPYKDSCLFTTTNYGLSVIRCADYSIKKYYASDGLHSNAFEQLCGTFYNGSVYAGGVNGFTIIKPVSFQKNQLKPLLYLSNLSISTSTKTTDTTNLISSLFYIPSNALQTVLVFSGLSYTNSERTSFRYRIKEQSSNWSEMPGNTLPLIGVSPGTYHLQVQAFNEDGVPSEIKELTLIFLPKWYQTLFFKIMVALSIVAIGYALYRIRINQLKKEQQIRSKLASDLHDDLGSTMNSVKLYSNLAMMEQPPDKYLPLIRDGAQHAINGIRDIIWVLDDSKDSIDDLLARISSFASPLCEANKILYRYDIADNTRDYQLKKEERRNLYMMMKEAVNNAIKYAECSTITITVSSAKRKLLLQVKDDGKGFDAGQTGNGNGLKNMQQRAKEIGYNVTFDTAPGNGTAIRLEKI